MSDALAAVSRLQVPNEQEMLAAAQSAHDMASSFAVDSDEDYQLAADELKAVKGKIKRLEEKRQEIVGPLLQAQRAVNALFKGPLELLARVEGDIKGKLIRYSQAQEAKAAEERAKADAALRAMNDANAFAAVDTFAKALDIVNASHEQAPVKAAGISKVREIVKARVTDKAAFLQFAASRPELHAMVEISESKLSAMAKAMGGAMEYPGVEVYTDKSISARAT